MIRMCLTRVYREKYIIMGILSGCTIHMTPLNQAWSCQCSRERSIVCPDLHLHRPRLLTNLLRSCPPPQRTIIKIWSNLAGSTRYVQIMRSAEGNYISMLSYMCVSWHSPVSNSNGSRSVHWQSSEESAPSIQRSLRFVLHVVTLAPTHIFLKHTTTRHSK